MPNPKKIFTGVDLTGSRGVNFGDPVNPGDAVNLQYLANYIRGLRFKEPVRAATTANITLTAPGASIDGVALAVGDRVLVKNQTTGSENGVFIWQGAAAAMTRAVDADSAAELQSAVVVVSEGTATDATGALLNADRAWLQRSDNITVGTTALSWIPLPGAGTSYLNGNGLALNATTFSVVAAAGGGITVGASGVALDPNVAVRKYAANIGGSSTIDVVHGLATTDVTWALRETASGAYVDTDVVVKDANTLTFAFAVAPSAGALRVVVHA